MGGQAFNFGNEAPVSVLEIVKEIQGLMGRDDLQPQVVGTARGEIHSQYLSAKKARDMLGWRSAFSLRDGLRETIDWYVALLSSAVLQR
jgi:CDP-glucose 4,6-dehydratase